MIEPKEPYRKFVCIGCLGNCRLRIRTKRVNDVVEYCPTTGAKQHWIVFNRKRT